MCSSVLRLAIVRHNSGSIHTAAAKYDVCDITEYFRMRGYDAIYEYNSLR
jgi:hypothetical protein